jgi:hypothetical protein
MTPNQIIMARGYWEGLPDGAAAAQAANPLSEGVRPLRKMTASAAPSITSVVDTWPGAHEDRVPPQLALAYAEQPEQSTPYSTFTLMGSATPRAADRAPQLPPPAATTIAVKRGADQTASTIVAAPARPTSAVGPGARFDNPWLRAVVMSASVRSSLTTVTLGTQDTRSMESLMASLMHKPASSVMMTFSAEPNPGLTHDHFAGSAIVFLPTVTYQTHTASLH